MAIDVEGAVPLLLVYDVPMAIAFYRDVNGVCAYLHGTDVAVRKPVNTYYGTCRVHVSTQMAARSANES